MPSTEPKKGRHSRQKTPQSAENCPRCSADESLRGRWERELGASLETITLPAQVLRDRSPYLVPQATMVEWAQCSAQSLRNYARRGMRVHGKTTRPLYQPGEVVNWMRYANYLKASGQPREQIEQDEAGQHALAFDASLEPSHYVLVPLDHDHPQREYWLRKAADGLHPDPTLDELREHFASRDADDLADLEHDHDDDGDDEL
jgi:hypothetical protein